MTIKEIQQIIKDFEKSELMTLELEVKDVKIKLSKLKETEKITTKHIENKAQIEAVSQAQTTEDKPQTDETPVKSPLVGTFYAQASPDQPAYVKVGDYVKKGQVVCIIEAMKIMNEITAPESGVIKAIKVENKDVISFDQVLMTIGKPS